MKIICWGVFRKGKLLFYDNIPLIYRYKNRAQGECNIFEDDEVKKIEISIKEIK